MKKLLAFPFVFFLLLGSASAQSSLIGKLAPAFTLEDQHDKQTSLQFPTGQHTFLLFSDREDESAKQADQWGSELVSEYGKDIKVYVIGVAKNPPAPIRKKVKNGMIKKKSDPILLDWGKDVAEKYEYTDKSSMVVYIDKNGIVQAVEKGAYSDPKYNKLTEKLDEALGL